MNGFRTSSLFRQSILKSKTNAKYCLRHLNTKGFNSKYPNQNRQEFLNSGKLFWKSGKDYLKCGFQSRQVIWNKIKAYVRTKPIQSYLIASSPIGLATGVAVYSHNIQGSRYCELGPTIADYLCVSSLAALSTMTGTILSPFFGYGVLDYYRSCNKSNSNSNSNSNSQKDDKSRRNTGKYCYKCETYH